MVLLSSLLVISVALVIALAIAAAGSSSFASPADRELLTSTLMQASRPVTPMANQVARLAATATSAAATVAPSAPLIFAAGLQ